ncbi:MAG: hypothetical protein B6247_30195 [Candidatus Parabeggiatoa sp. nov. 2]|nr:MAG: hypothetical protein B6247_30195 [Beggiatoa sp. 4572_84]
MLPSRFTKFSHIISVLLRNDVIVPNQGIFIESIETKPNNEIDLVGKVISSFNAAKQVQNKMPKPYLPSGGWEKFLNNEWQKNYYDATSQKNVTTMAALLRNFFRNEAISGIWGNEKMFNRFCHLSKLEALFKSNLIKSHYVVWKNTFPTVPLKELEAPKFGNPWGYRFDNTLLYEPVFEYNFHAHYFDNLLHNLQNPVVVEIGGGFGGLAYQLLCCRSSIKYIGFDLPENILIQTYYLSCTFPNAKILTYSGDSVPLTSELLEHYDIVLLPNFELPQLESSIADIIINIRSLSEMSKETIIEYFNQIDRIGRLFFYHENIYKPRSDGLFGIPSTDFPALNNFVLASASETRWPKYQSDSGYPCQENLFIHRNVLR